MKSDEGQTVKWGGINEWICCLVDKRRRGGEKEGGKDDGELSTKFAGAL